MKYFVPDYYEKFKCIADRCTHSCCVGWEIDIDAETLEYYENLDSPLGECIRRSISYEGTPHFALGEDERCPHLDERGLCRIISELGERATCEICRLHPRYRNFFSDRVETGLGMCCEEACRVILSHIEKIYLVLAEDDGAAVLNDEYEAEILGKRDRAVQILQNRSINIDKRITDLCVEFDVPFFNLSVAEWSEIYKKLENLDPKWSEILEIMGETDSEFTDAERYRCPEVWQEQLIVYFLLRHTPIVLSGASFSDYLKFALLSFFMVREAAAVMSNGDDVSFEALCEAARLYSSEIEYSDENVDELILELSFN